MSFRIFLRLLCFLLLPACAPVDILNATVPQEGYRLQPDIAYGTLSRQKLDLYLPGKVTRDTPVVVFFYGGSWSSGDKAEYLFIGQGLASLGMIAAIPDYRLYPDIRYPEFLRDNALAVTWVYNHIGKYKGNSENLYLMGHSAGAYDAVMLALNPLYLEKAGGREGWIRGVIGLAGPYDFLPLTDPDIIAVFAGEPDLAKTQPIHYVRAHVPRMLLLSGGADDKVSPENSQELAGALRKLGNDATYKEYSGIGHIGLILGVSDAPLAGGFLRKDIGDFMAAR